jgi:hypothetical protein
MERDFDKNPYSPDEQRVAKWIVDKTGIGGGDDPIGFLMVSHEYVVAQRNCFAKRLGTNPNIDPHELELMLDSKGNPWNERLLPNSTDPNVLATEKFFNELKS